MARAPLFTWEGTQYSFAAKSTDWYWALGILALAGVVASILLGNIILALVIIAAAAAMGLQAAKQPRIHRFSLINEGLVIDNRLYPYDTMLHFSVLEYLDPSLPPALSIKTRSLLAPHLLVPLSGVDPDAVYAHMEQILEEGHHETSLIDRLVEMFQL